MTSHTSTYNKYYEEKGNEDYLFFDSRTFGINEYADPCEKITNDKYRKFIQMNFKCVGVWCVDNAFSCKTLPCYHVEHIYPKAGVDFNESCYDLNIAGNLVFSYSTWNLQLSNKFMQEKDIVYGHEIMQRVSDNIKKCSTCPVVVDIDTSDEFIVPYVLGILTLFIPMCILAIIYWRCKRSDTLTSNQIALSNW